MEESSSKTLASNIEKRIKKNEKILVSLTSYPTRIKTVNQTIETLINQTFKPDKIVLWLAEEEFPNKENDLPEELLNLQRENKSFEIGWCEDLKPYKKLIPSLKKYPEYLIITADDDLLYEPNRIGLLYKTHLKYPNDAICHRAHYITFDKNVINKYSNWIMNSNFHGLSNNVFPTSGAMILYPQNCFYKDILNKELFLKLSYNTDDIWYWAMCVLNGTKTRLARENISELYLVEKTQTETLWSDNINNGKNDNNINLMFEHYPMLYAKLSKKLPIYYMARNLFSVTNSDDKNYKIITILGLRFKIRRVCAKR